MKLDEYGYKEHEYESHIYYTRHGRYDKIDGPAVYLHGTFKYYFINGYQINEKDYDYVVNNYIDKIYTSDLLLQAQIAQEINKYLIDCNIGYELPHGWVLIPEFN